MRSACVLALALSACTSVSSLDAPRRPLDGSEPQTVRQKSDEATKKKDFAVAWNHEFHAGGDRDRLEAIFLAALEDGSSAATDMMAQLKKAFGGLSAPAQAKVNDVSERAEKTSWVRAAEIQILAAADAPKFEAAWDVYRRAPPKDALSVLEAIQDARKEHEEASAKRGP
jgi:hypothetical protein